MQHLDMTRRTVLKGLGAVVATTVLNPGPAAAAATTSAPTTWTDVLGHFESRHEPWSITVGAEYGGSRTAFTRVAEGAPVGGWYGRLDTDFSAGGRYGGLVKTLDHLDVTRVTMKVRAENVSRVTVRLVSGDRTLRQGYAAVTPGSSTWQDVEVTAWNGIAGFEDAVTMQIQVWKDHLTGGNLAGALLLDDIRVEHTVTPVVPASLTTAGLPVVLTDDEDLVPLTVRATYEDGSTRDVTQHSDLASSDPTVLTVDEYGYLVPVGAGSAVVTVDHLGARQEFAVDVRAPQALAPLRVVEGRLMAGDAPFGFTGFNYDLFMLSYPRRASWSGLDSDIAVMASWGLGAVRVPMNLGMVQAARGVFPDDEAWAGEIAAHGLNTEWMAMLDHFVERAGKHGVRTIIDWHRGPVDPYDYWIGGVAQDAGTGKPGTAIAYLAPSPTERGELDMSNPEHLATLLDSHRWIAAHFKDDPAVLGVEIPHNEPHDAYMSIQSNWRRVTERCAAAVKAGDPERLTFTMPPAYGHDVSTAAPTWQVPFGVDGTAPHHYLPNAPVPTRDDAPDRHSPWLARDVDAVFSHAIASLFAPYSTSSVPVYNGEGGHYGFESFLPDMDKVEAADLMMEAGMVQYYAAGAAGQLHWSLWHNANDYVPFVESFARHYRRFSPVYAAGPVSWRGARVAVVQNPAAAPISNGHNWSAVPFVRLALDLHLGPFHLLTDDEVIDRLLTQVPSGLEQVDGLSASFDYDAVVVDRRNLDERVRSVLERDDLDVPVLWVDDMEQLGATALASFLTGAGVQVDRRTSPGVQLVTGPAHLLVYRRDERSPGRVRVHPRIPGDGPLRLVDESGTTVYDGTSADLWDRGVRVEIETWRSAILRIER